MRTLLFPCFLFFIAVIMFDPALTKRHWTLPAEQRAKADSGQNKSQNVRIVFWNVENLYDPYDDTTTLDDEFTSSGSKHWTYSKFRKKLNLLAKTLITIGGWEPPVIIGMCEVENKYVLNKLIYETPLKSWKFKALHHESPDARGIDVAMIYRPEKFKLLWTKTFSINFPFDTIVQTREILMVKGLIFDSDTLNIFINHWPSRRGGYVESQPRRNWVAGVLRKLVDSVQSEHPASNIVIMGDFNDEPDKESISSILGAKEDTIKIFPTGLVNLMFPKIRREGTIKYQGNWSILDQFIVSVSVFSGNNGLHADFRDAQIVRMDFLLNEDVRYLGSKPIRTYIGPRYNGGFSDHLPISLQIWSVRH